MKLFKKFFNKETGLYLFYGVCTTIINYFTFILWYNWIFKGSPLVANTIAFIAATLFAYVTNKLFVFRSYGWNLKVLVPEVFSFVSARILSFVFEQAALFVYIEYFLVENFMWFGIDSVMIVKVVLSFIVVVINYFISKLLIFK